MKNRLHSKQTNSFQSAPKSNWSFTSKLFYAGLNFTAMWQGLQRLNLNDLSSCIQLSQSGVATIALTVMSYTKPRNNHFDLPIALGLWHLCHAGADAQDAKAIWNITDLVNNQGWLAQGDTSADRTGSSVSYVGDVNGDSKVDYLISAPYASPLLRINGIINTGIVYLIYGGSNLPKNLDLVNFNSTYGTMIYGKAWNSRYLGSVVSALGDVNNDGLADFLIVAAGGNRQGNAFLIKGNRNFPAILDLDKFNSSYGTVISNAVEGMSFNGIVVGSGVGDVNGDGNNDFLIGTTCYDDQLSTECGNTFLIFGSNTLLETIHLSNFSTSAGLIIKRDSRQHFTTFMSTMSVGDINGDNKADFLLGAPVSSSSQRTENGIVYLLYGKEKFAASLDLAVLDATDGTVIYGASSSDALGSGMGGVGDVNKDGKNDFLVISRRASPLGRSSVGIGYLIYGRNSFPGVFDLAGFTANDGILIYGAAGITSFGITGDAPHYQHTIVASAGDIDGDGYSDFLMGASISYSGNIPGAGNTYFIYGGNNLPSILDLATFDSSQGFIIQGVIANEWTGYSLSTIKEINNTNLQYILIGAPSDFYRDQQKSSGRAYTIVTGKLILLNDINPINNQIYVSYSEDKNTLLGLVINLLYRAQKLTVALTPSVQTAGKFNFPQYNLTYDGMTWQVAGEYRALVLAIKNLQFQPSSDYNQNFTISLNLTPDNRTSEQYVIQMQGVPVNDSPLLIAERLDLTENEVTVLNRTLLLAGDIDDLIAAKESTILYKIVNSNLVNFFRVNDTAKSPLQQFTQGEVNTQAIEIFPTSHSVTKIPQFSFIIRDQEGGESELYTSNITYHVVPKIVNNQLMLGTPGETVVYKTSNLQVNYGEDNAQALELTISNVRGGYFTLNNQKKTPPFSFQQNLIVMGQLSFVHDGSDLLPAYDVSASDGRRVDGPQRVTASAAFAKNQAPYIVNNHLEVHEGQMVVINNTNLLAKDETAEGMGIQYLVDVVTVAHAVLSNNFLQENNTLRFTQADIDRKRITLQHDGSELAPVVRFRLSDNDIASEDYYLNVTFVADVNDAPTVKVTEWLIEQGKTIVLNREQWQALDSDNDPESLTYSITKATHGEFRRVGSGEVITMFTQAEINAGQIEFIHDDSEGTPEIEYSVSDGKLTTMPQPVPVKFIQRPVNDNSVVIGASVAGGVVCAVGLFAVGYVAIRKRQAYVSRQGTDLNKVAARTVYEQLKIQDVANFKSGPGLKYLAQIAEINRAYQDVYGNIVDKDGYSQSLARAIREVLSRDREVVVSSKSMKFNIADETKQRPLHQHQRNIVERCHSFIRQNQADVVTTEQDVPMRMML